VAAKADYQQRDGVGESQLEMIRRLELPLEAFRSIRDHAESRGILFLSTPFDVASLEFLLDLGMPAVKVGSGELTNVPFLRALAASGRPVIQSTGMSTLSEVGEAVALLRPTGSEPLVLLHCVSEYPADPSDANLRAMETMARAYDVPVGFSDHTLGAETALAAVALGAVVIEKHLTLDRALPGPDHAASMPPDEFGALVTSIRTVGRALGDGIKAPRAGEAGTAAVARRSLVAVRDLAPGTVLTAELVAIRRPGTGLAPSQFDAVIGRTVRTRVRAGEPLTREVLS
jgi:sialic acid synthase SpsE